jgi:hypothetical protein
MLKTQIRIALDAFNCWAELLGIGHTPLSCPYPAHIAGPLSYADCIMLYRVSVMVAAGLFLFNAVKVLLPRDNRFKRFMALKFALLTVLFLTIYYPVFQWKLDERYFIEVVLIFSVTFPVLSILLLDAIWRSRGFIKIAHLMLVVIICACLLNYSAMGMSVWQNGPEAVGAYSLNHRSMLKGALWVNRNIPSDAIMGAFNPGIYGYYMNNPVVDLVGIANKAAWDAAKKGELLHYIWQKKVDYILDFAIDIDRFYTQYLTHGDQSFLNYIVEGPLFADRAPLAPIHLYIVKNPDGGWDGIPRDELMRRAEKDTF